MIDLRCPAEVDALVAATRALATKMIAPVAGDLDRRCEIPEPVLGELHAMGLLHPVAERFGGQGLLPPAVFLAVLEELARADAGTAFVVAMSALPAAVLSALDHADGPDPALSMLADDSAARVSTLLLEGFGRTPGEFATTATTDSDGGCLLDGRKVAVTWPDEAGPGFVVATDADSGALCACVLEGRAGIELERDDRLVGKLGLRSAPTGIVRLDRAEARLLRVGGDDPLRLLRMVEHTRLGLAAICVGIGASALDYAVGYADQREAFGRRIAEYQGVSFPLAELRMRIDAARMGTWRALRGISAGTSAAEIGDLVSRTLGYAAEVAVEATRTGINTLGGHGYLEDHPVERWYRAATTLSALCCDPLLLELKVL